MDALITAGGPPNDAVARAARVPVKALLDLDGAPMLDHTMQALRACPEVARIILVGGPALHAYRERVDAWADDTGQGWSNFLAGLEKATPDRPCLFCCSDLPYLETPGLRAFLNDCDPEAVLNYSVVRREDFRHRFPGARRRFVPLREGGFTGGGVFLVQPQGTLSIATTVRNVFEARKNTLRIAWMLGLPFLIGRLLGTLSLPDLEARASAVTGVRCRAIPSEAGLGFDLDTLDDLRYISAKSR